MSGSPTIFYVQGICLIILGILAVLWPTISSIAVEIMVGWLFLFGGIIKFIKSAKSRASFFHYLIALAYFFVGLFLLIYPIQGLRTLTLALALLFFVQGIIEISWSFTMPVSKGLFLISGILSLILGFILWTRWPSDASWVIGIIAGINFIVTGIIEILFAKTLAKK